MPKPARSPFLYQLLPPLQWSCFVSELARLGYLRCVLWTCCASPGSGVPAPCSPALHMTCLLPTPTQQVSGCTAPDQGPALNVAPGPLAGIRVVSGVSQSLGMRARRWHRQQAPEQLGHTPLGDGLGLVPRPVSASESVWDVWEAWWLPSLGPGP